MFKKIMNILFDEEEEINEYDLTLYIKDEDARFVRFQETHYQRCYTLDTIQRLLKEAGMEFVAAFDEYSNKPVHSESERILIVARECGK